MPDQLDLLDPTNSDTPKTPYVSPFPVTLISGISKYNLPYVNYNPYNLTSPLTSGYYTDLNNDKTVIKTIVKYFYYKIIDKWLYNDLLPLLGFITIIDGKPKLIKNLNDYKIDKNSISDSIDAKIDYIENILITKNMVKHVLKKIVQKENVKWYNLYKYENQIKQKFYKYIKSKLEDAIEN